MIASDTDLRLVCSKVLKDHFADATVSQSFKAYEGQPLSLPTEPASPKPEYPPSLYFAGQRLACHRNTMCTLAVSSNDEVRGEGLSSEGMYYFRVVAIGDKGESPVSDIALAKAA